MGTKTLLIIYTQIKKVSISANVFLSATKTCGLQFKMGPTVIRIFSAPHCTAFLKARHRRELNPVLTSQECHHRGLLLFCCCCNKGKSKTWRNKTKILFPQEKKTTQHLAAILFCHHMGISLGQEAETRRKRQLVSPIPSIPHNDTELAND